jgi:hypothetical protein
MNVLLSEFKHGWSAAYIYELIDGGGEAGDPSTGWGIYNQNQTPKLAATYIHNLTTVRADTVSNPPGSLSYSIPHERNNREPRQDS